MVGDILSLPNYHSSNSPSCFHQELCCSVFLLPELLVCLWHNWPFLPSWCTTSTFLLKYSSLFTNHSSLGASVGHSFSQPKCMRKLRSSVPCLALCFSLGLLWCPPKFIYHLCTHWVPDVWLQPQPYLELNTYITVGYLKSPFADLKSILNKSPNSIPRQFLLLYSDTFQ